MQRSFVSKLSIIAIMAFASFQANAQVRRPDFNRAHDYDVQNYVIHASFDRANKRVNGDTTVAFKPITANFRSIELDAVALTFSSIEDESGASLKYRVTPTKVIVSFDKVYGPSDTISVRFKYTTKPTKGVYFRDGEENRSAQVWSQGEAEEARYWFPSFDFPSDKATSEEYLTANSDEVAVGNGELIDRSPNPDGTVIWHYKMSIPHSTYLLSFVIGKYTRLDDKYGKIPLGYYVYPGWDDIGRSAFGDTPKMMAAFEKLTGVTFPYNKYDQTVVSNFQFGGMENITATTMADGEISLAQADFGKGIVTDLVSHELAHSWFGDLVTCKNWAELWLNEGFATYMEAAYREAAYGHDDYVKKIKADADEYFVDEAVDRHPYGLFNQQAANVDALFNNSAITYNKGGVVLYMLREQVGRDNFWKALNTYLNRFKYGNVESSDLRKVMEETSGQDLGWFFDQWVYDTGMPHLTITPTYNRGLKTLSLTIDQTQLPNALTPSAFRLPLTVRLTTPAGTSDSKIEITKRIQTVTIKTDTKPTAVNLDPDYLVPLKRIRMKPVMVR